MRASQAPGHERRAQFRFMVMWSLALVLVMVAAGLFVGLSPSTMPERQPSDLPGLPTPPQASAPADREVSR